MMGRCEQDLKILHAGAFVFFLTIWPLLLGGLFVDSSWKERTGAYTLPAMWCTGYLTMSAVFYIPAVACILLKRRFSDLFLIWCILLLCLTVLSVVLLVRRRLRPLEIGAAWFKGLTFAEIAALVLVLAHAVVTFVFQYVNNDDYVYVANATTTLDTNTLLKYVGGTGQKLASFHAEDMDRLVSSPQFAYYAAVAKLSGTRPAALCHTYLPPVLTCLFFASFFLVGYRLFKGDRVKTGLFTVIVFLVCAGSAYSTYTAGLFLMVRSWQGKAQIVGMILPLILWIYLGVLHRMDMSVRDAVLLAVVLEASCLMTSMGAVLSAAAAIVLAAAAAWVCRKGKILLYSLPPLVLPAATALFYLALHKHLL